MPRCFSTSIQSEVAWRALLRALTVPAIWIAPPYSRSFSVSVVLPASGCEMIANVRRRATSPARSAGKVVALIAEKSRQPLGGRRIFSSANYTLRAMADRVPTYHPAPSAPALALPKGACDAHVHVFGPERVFPFDPARPYTPA